MKRIFSTVLACALCVPLMAAPAHAAADPVVRVGLAYGSSALAAPQLQNVDGAGYEIGKMNGTTFVPQTRVSCDQLTIKPDGGGLAVIDTQTGKVVYETEDESLAISPNGELTWFNKYKYYGDFRYTRDGGSVSVINYVDLEDYIKGVVPYEMSASWPREALKAQAVCVRSYADGLMGKHKSQGFDLCATTHCEVYRGANSATANSDAAVEETRGESLWADGKKVVGYYFSSDGGATEDAVNVWGGDYSYLVGVPDPYEDVENAYNGVWSKTLTSAEVAAKLKSAGYSIGTVQSVQVTGRTAMNNVAELTITDTGGKQVKLTRSACRTVFGLNSIRYSLDGSGAKVSNASAGGVYVNAAAQSSSTFYAVGDGGTSKIGTLSGKTALTSTGKQTLSTDASANTVSESAVSGSSYTFSGTGWGHSVGMSQYGAKAMAEQGFTYDEILAYYFTGISVK